jgi:acetolactate synthase-1/3 small subunit
LSKCKLVVTLEALQILTHPSSAKQSRIDSFLKLVAPFGILESARTGLMALPRSPLNEGNQEALTMEADDVVDASQLPPG